MINFYLSRCEAYYRWYEKNYAYFSADERRIKALRFFKIISAVIMYAAYAAVLACLLLAKDMRIIKAILVPASGFVLVTLIRSGINAPRPYERFPLKPVLPKSTKGNSCPSRHSACSVLIALTLLFVNVPAGIALIVLSVLIAVSRIFMGVHFPLDVILGLLTGVLPAVIGFWLIP